MYITLTLLAFMYMTSVVYSNTETLLASYTWHLWSIVTLKLCSYLQIQTWVRYRAQWGLDHDSLDRRRDIYFDHWGRPIPSGHRWLTPTPHECHRVWRHRLWRHRCDLQAFCRINMKWYVEGQKGVKSVFWISTGNISWQEKQYEELKNVTLLSMMSNKNERCRP